MKKIGAKQLAVLGLFAALAYAVMIATRWIPPLVPALPFLKYDPKDVIIAIAGFIFGPLWAFAIAIVVSLVEMITVGTTGFIGFLMNLLSTSAFVMPAAVFYSVKKNFWSAAIGLILGVLSVCSLMLLWNYFLTPIYMGYPREAIAKLLLPAFLPFNLIKSLINAALTILLYKPIVTALRRANLLPASTGAKKNPIAFILIGVLLLGSAIALIFIIRQ